MNDDSEVDVRERMKKHRHLRASLFLVLHERLPLGVFKRLKRRQAHQSGPDAAGCARLKKHPPLAIAA